jgi:hypothetical protein
MLHNQLSVWLRNNGMFVLKGEKKDITHLCLDGGRLNIPQDRHDEFMKLYLQCFTDRNEKYYICEVPTEVSRMYVDVDLLEGSKISTSQIALFVACIYGCVEEYFGEYDIIVCKTKSTKMKKNDTIMVKTGVHLIWPDLYVKNNTALKLSKLFVTTLLAKFGERNEHNPWSDAIDSNVYNQKLPSLRMVGSRKIKRDKDGKFVDVDRVYLPDFVIKKNETIGVTKSTIEDTINKTFLRIFENETSWTKDLPDVAVASIETVKRKYNLECADELSGEIEEFINGCGVDSWEDATVRAVIKEKEFYTVKVEDTMYCLNKQDEHNRCGIYFVIFESGMKQKCFCSCDTTEGRVSGKCCNYSSKYFELGEELKNKLFPKNKVKLERESYEYNPGNSFPSFALLDKNPKKFGNMLKNTVRFYNKDNKD